MNLVKELKQKKRIIVFLALFLFYGKIVQAQPCIPTGQVDIFVGVDFNYRDLLNNGRVYDLLINLTPGVKWNMGKGWQAAAQGFIPIVNQYGERYKK